VNTLAVSLDLFLIVTFTGVFLYLIRIYNIWDELSIGFWAVGSLFVASSVISHLISLHKIENSISQAEFLYKIAISLSYFGFWTFGVSHMIARRNILDNLGISFLSISFGALIHSLWTSDIEFKIQENTIYEESFEFSGFYIGVFIFFISLYLLLTRDSLLIYLASKKNQASRYHRTNAYTHLLAWQFWALSTILSRFIASNLLTFAFPLVFLLVPIITLGSRPFDWAREGHEPLLLLLIDDFGTPAFSWSSESTSPLLMEGSSIASIKSMLENITQDTTQSMRVNYMNSSMYLQYSNGYLSLLITSGHHQSFMKLLTKIHQILVTAIVGPSEFGIPGYELPNELTWLLSQLLPNEHLRLNNHNVISSGFFTGSSKIPEN
jgi:hypothetical protein